MEECREVICPYCAQDFVVFVDISAGNQEVVEDCQVCCQPVGLRIAVEDGEIQNIEAYPSD
jgi:hypothetical protein